MQREIEENFENLKEDKQKTYKEKEIYNYGWAREREKERERERIYTSGIVGQRKSG